MTSNEKVCERMGWEIKDDNGVLIIGYWDNMDYFMSDLSTDTPAGHWLMHLMKQKLVEEGWTIRMRADKDSVIYEAEDGEEYFETDSFPPDQDAAAVNALAVKCWNIKEG